MELKNTLDHLYALYKGEYLESDPVSLAHRFKKKRDIEIVGLLAALFAFGRVDLIIGAVEKILGAMGMRPFEYLEDSTEKKIISDFRKFQYRFVKGADLAALLIALKITIQRDNGLGNLVRSFGKTGLEGQELPQVRVHTLSEEKVWRLCLSLRELLFGRGLAAAERHKLKIGRGFLHLLADPAKSSACKRWFLFFRWMVRKDEIDFGLWEFIKPGELLMPVDTHISRIGFLIGLTKRKGAGAAMVKEITDNLRRIDQVDPLKYDFALTRLGILKECPSKRVEALCGRCTIKKICSLNF
jgi:uncharacterized protein (TIGR02757 family)